MIAILNEILAELRVLRAEQAALGRALGVRVDGGAEGALLREVFAYFGDREWTASELLAEGEVDAAIKAALARVGVRIEAPRPADKLAPILRRLRVVPTEGLRLVQSCAQNRRGVAVWRVTGISPSIPGTSSSDPVHDEQHEDRQPNDEGETT